MLSSRHSKAYSKKLESRSSLAHKKILITCGPVWTRIDPVRVISNISSGELGHIFCQKLLEHKANVTLLQGPTTHFFHNPKVQISSFAYFDEFSSLLRQMLRSRHYDVVIHAAAVSDYQVKKPSKKKIDSRLSGLHLDLVPTPKLIGSIKKISPGTLLVGFKLQTDPAKTQLLHNAKKLIAAAGCDLVIANTAQNKKYHAFLINSAGQIIASASSRQKIAEKLIAALKDSL